jgi:hypothetical protein
MVIGEHLDRDRLGEPVFGAHQLPRGRSKPVALIRM